MNRTDKLLTVADVMEIIPLGKTSVTAIIKTLPCVTMGRKLMVYRSDVDQWIAQHTRQPQQAMEIKRKPKPKGKPIPGMTDDGLHLLPRRSERRSTA